MAALFRFSLDFFWFARKNIAPKAFVGAPATMAMTTPRVVAPGAAVSTAGLRPKSRRVRVSRRTSVHATSTNNFQGRKNLTSSSNDVSNDVSPATYPSSKRSPFPMEVFTANGAASSGRFLWASRGITNGTGLKPLDWKSDWFEEDFDESDEKIANTENKKDSKWVRELRIRHELIDSQTDLGCTVWNETAAPAVEALLPKMCHWLVNRYPYKYVRTPDGGLELPELNWQTGPLDSIKGIDAMKTCAKLVQEDLCFVREETLEEAWEEIDGQIDREVDTGAVDTSGDTSRIKSSANSVNLTPKHTFEAGVVCFSFDPRKRAGKTLAELHAPVPGYEEKMKQAMSKVFTNLDSNKPLWRANWALQNNGQVISTALEWHPSNVEIGGVSERKKFAENDGSDGDSSTFSDSLHVGFMDPLSELPSDAKAAGEQIHLRVEYETVMRLGDKSDRAVSRWILFTVKTHLDSISKLDDESCGFLLNAIEESDAEELSYKSLGNETLRESVVEYLSHRSEVNTVDTGTTSATALPSPQTNNAVSTKKCPMGFSGEKTGKVMEVETQTPLISDPTPEPKASPTKSEPNLSILFESGRASVADKFGIDPWPTSALGISQSKSPPASWYFDPAVFKLKTSTLFAKGWQVIGRVDQLPVNAPTGTYFTYQLGSAFNLIITRDKNNELNAFHNQCRHRAMELVQDPNDANQKNQKNSWSRAFKSKRDKNKNGGKGDTFRTVGCDTGVVLNACFSCPYHGWEYDLDGSLTKIPKLSGTENFDIEKNGLKKVEVTEWGGFIWAHLGGKVE